MARSRALCLPQGLAVDDLADVMGKGGRFEARR